MMSFFFPPKKTVECFFCDTKSAPKLVWKLDVNTADGVIVKNVCEECATFLTRIQSGESLRRAAAEEDDDDE